MPRGRWGNASVAAGLCRMQIRKEPEKAKAKKKKLAVIICILIVLIVGSYSAIKAAKEKSEGGEESKVSELQESDVGNEVIGGFDLEW